MLHKGDIVEEIATKRQGKIDSISSSVTGGVETPNQWRVQFSDGQQPPLKYFTVQEKLRLVSCPHDEPTEPRFVPSRPIME